ERAPVAEVLRVESPRRPLERDLVDTTRRVGPPLVHGAVRGVWVFVQVAEQVEAHRHRRQQIAAETRGIDHLVPLTSVEPRSDSGTDAIVQEARLRLLCVPELDATTDRPGTAAARPLVADGQAVA